MATNENNLDAARAALTDPATRSDDLLEICRVHPSLGAEAAMHPAADRTLLEWLVSQGDAITSATAQARLSTLPPPDQFRQPVAGPTTVAASAVNGAGTPPAQDSGWSPQVVQFSQPAPGYPAGQAPAPAGQAPAPAGQAPAPAGQGTSRRSRLLITAAAVGVLTLALVATGVFVVLPWLTGSGGTYTYAPDFREQPGILAVDAQAGLPTSGDQTWYTSFVPVPGTGITLAYNSTSAFSDYREKLAEYNAAEADYRQWESDYNAGYADGTSCLTHTDQMGWYSSMEEYCIYNESSYLTISSMAGEAGYSDAAFGRASTPSHPGSDYYTAPQVPARPTPPTTGDNVLGIDMKTGKVAWTLDLSSTWTGVQPSAYLSTTDAGRTLLVMRDPTQDSNAEARLAILDDKTGAVSVSRTMDSADVIWAGLYGDIVVVADDDLGLRGISAADLSTQKWTTSAEFLGNTDEYAQYGFSELPGYLLTADGYIKTSDGTKADFARDAGQDGVQLRTLGGTNGDVIRVELTEDGIGVAGFDTGRNAETWRLDEVSAMPVKAGGLLLAPTGEDVTAYRINGSDLEREWRYSCAGRCAISFADDNRVFVEDFGQDGDSEAMILKTSDGTKLDRIRDASGYGPLVGRSVAYLRTQDRLVAYDLEKDGVPTLWRSRDVSGWLAVYDGALVLVGGGDGATLGILGLDGDDWSEFTPEG